MKLISIIIAAILIIGGIVYFITKDTPSDLPEPVPPAIVTPEPPEEVVEEERGDTTIIGTSTNGNDITAYHFGTGDTELLFVGGIHGAYSWNTALVAFELVDYLKENPTLVPENVTVTVIPVLNPDGLEKVTGKTDRFLASDIPASTEATIPGRFNANNVDLNRNFECEWQTSGTWQSRTVSGGSAPFSESESQAIRDYVTEHTPSAAVVWYSAAGGVYASNCLNGVLPETTEIMNVYATASKYPAYQEYNYYEITGDMANWFAKQNIPTISVLLTNHTNTDWSKNEAGVKALLTHYAE